LKFAVAEILMLRVICQLKKKALVILPFVSVVAEKAAYFEKIFGALDLSVKGFYANHVRSHSPHFALNDQSNHGRE
jgi:DNA polymerase theta